MNHYKYISLAIQDLSTCELIHTVTSIDYDEVFQLSSLPLKFFVSSDNIESLLRTREIAESMCNSLYELSVAHKTEKELDEYNEQTPKVIKTTAYLDNILVYNISLEAENNAKRNKKKTVIELGFKKINRNRFQVVEEFTSIKPYAIETYDDYEALPYELKYANTV